MNICFYTHRLPNPNIGGVERVTYNLCNYFKKIGLGVYNLTYYGPDNSQAFSVLTSNDEKRNYINKFLVDNHIDVLIDQYGDNPLLEHPHISRHVKIVYCYHLDPEGKHLTRSLLETFSIKALKYSLLNLAFVINSPRRRYRYKNKLNRKLNGGVDKVVYLSENYLPYIMDMMNISGKMLSAIPNAIEEKLIGVSDMDTTPMKNKTIMWCGRIAHNPKNVLFLPRLWKALQDKHPDWKMILVGDGIDRQLLERRMNKYDLKNIQITGTIDPYPYYEKASIFVSPSFSEGFGMVIVEAMAHGCVPIVFNTSRAYPDIINSGSNGYIVPDMDEKAFFDACDKLMDNAGLCASLGKKAQQDVRKFSIDKVCAKWLTLFNEICS